VPAEAGDGRIDQGEAAGGGMVPGLLAKPADEDGAGVLQWGRLVAGQPDQLS